MERTKKTIQKKLILQMMMGFLAGRAVFFGYDPIGAAFFTGCFLCGGNVLPVGIAICLGMVSALPLEAAARYAASMLAVVIASDLMDQYGRKIRLWQASAVMTASLAVLSVVECLILPFSWKELVYTGAELLTVLFLCPVFYSSLRVLFVRRGKQICPEELAGVLFVVMSAVCGIPDMLLPGISAAALIILFLVPAAAYQYGMGIGAAAGAFGGLMLFLKGQDAGLMGILCMIGLCTGAMNRRGRAWSLSACLLSAIVAGMLWEDGSLKMDLLEFLLADTVLLMLMPDKLFRRFRFVVGSPEEEETHSQRQMKFKLKDASRSFQRLSAVLEQQSRIKHTMSRHDIRVLMRRMSEEICEKCSNRDYCMGHVAISRLENTGILAMIQDQGRLLMEQMPSEFTEECIHPEWFLMETNRSLQMERMIMSYQNKLAQNRRILAGQMGQVGDMLDDLSENMGAWNAFPRELEATIRKELGNMRVSVGELSVYENRNGHIEVHMKAATIRGRLVTSKEVAAVLADIIGKPFLPSPESHNVIPKQKADMVFVEDTPYYAVTGVARMAKEGEEVSGDAFSCLTLPNGEMLLALSDGMGSGESALEESRVLIELLEQMTEAGFSRASALELINSLYVPENEEVRFATADIVVIDLYQGTCQFIKNGAAATWLRKRDGIKRIEGCALPVGVMQDMESYSENTEISSGDYVIMMTDGIVDSFDGREEELEKILDQKRIVNPGELARMILDEAVASCGGAARDDMSVVVAAVWKRSYAAKNLQRKQATRERRLTNDTTAIYTHSQEIL